MSPSSAGLVWRWIVVEMERSKTRYASTPAHESTKNWWVGLFRAPVRVHARSRLWMALRNFKTNNPIKSHTERMHDAPFPLWYHMISSRIEKLFDNVCAPYLFSRDRERNELSLYLAFDVWKRFPRLQRAGSKTWQKMWHSDARRQFALSIKVSALPTGILYIHHYCYEFVIWSGR